VVTWFVSDDDRPDDQRSLRDEQKVESQVLSVRPRPYSGGQTGLCRLARRPGLPPRPRTSSPSHNQINRQAALSRDNARCIQYNACDRFSCR